MSKATELLNATIISEIFSTGLARWLIFSVVCFGMSMFFLFFVFGDNINAVVCLSFLSGPPLSAVLWYYLGGHSPRQALKGLPRDLLILQSAGARAPSTREEQMLMPVLQQVIESAGAHVRSFNEIYIVDSPVEMIYTIGPYLIPSSSALRSRYLGAMLAHELGHIQNNDNNVAHALSDMMSKRYPQPKRPTLAEMSTGAVVAPGTDVEALQKGVGNVSKMLKLIRPQDAIFVVGFMNFFNTGGGVRRRGQEWAAYFREQDYKADAFAVQCGYKHQLIEHLEQRRLIEGSIPDGLAWQAPAELRIERLMNMEYEPYEPEEPFTIASEEPFRIEPEPIAAPLPIIEPPAAPLIEAMPEEEIVVYDAPISAEITPELPQAVGELQNSSMSKALDEFRQAMNEPEEEEVEINVLDDALANFRKATGRKG